MLLKNIAALFVMSTSFAFAQGGAKALFEDSTGTLRTVSTTPDASKKETAVARAKSQPTAKSAEQKQADPAKFVGLKYWLELVKPDGKVEQKTASYDFKSGDKVRIRVQSSTNGYIYILNEGSSGRTNLLFPTRNGPSAYIQAGSVTTVPAKGYFTFDDTPGVEKIKVALTSVPFSDDEPVKQPTHYKNAGSGMQQVALLDCGGGGSKDLFNEPKEFSSCLNKKSSGGSKDLFAEEDSNTATIQPANYVVMSQEKWSKEDALVVVDFELKHRSK
jgi:hypothetical protein